MAELYEIRATNFRSLRQVTVRLGRVTVLVGPNGAGKSNLIDVVGFLRDAVLTDLSEAVRQRGGSARVCFRGEGAKASFSLGLSCRVTKLASATAPDEYTLSVNVVNRRMNGAIRRLLRREEEFLFKRVKGPGRRIKISGNQIRVTGQKPRVLLQDDALALSTLPRLVGQGGYQEVEELAALLAEFRVFDIAVARARLPTVTPDEADDNEWERVLASDASNLSAFLAYLAREHAESFSRLQDDARAIVPGLEEIVFAEVGGPSQGVVVELVEQGLASITPLADASFGSIRALALLALLHDPEPPALTCIEEFDHGLHPYVFDLLIDRLREASRRTQFLVATHSPTLVNRLRPDELVVCERDPVTGESLIPAVEREQMDEIARFAEEEGIRLGEVWFSGALGGVPPA